MYTKEFGTTVFSKCLRYDLVTLFSRFGRRNTTILLYTLSSAASFTITICYFTIKSNDNFQLAMQILALTCRFFLGTTWVSVKVYTTELYPTVVR